MKKIRTIAATALVAGAMAVSAIPANAAPGTFWNGNCRYIGTLKSASVNTSDANGYCGVLGVQGVIYPAGTSTTVYTSWKYGAKSASIVTITGNFDNSKHSANTL